MTHDAHGHGDVKHSIFNFDLTKEGIDIYRDTPIRLMGYANEVGEAFRSMWHVNAVRFSYVVASGYVLADARDKSIKMWNQLKQTDETTDVIRFRVARTAVDTVIWQALASVIIPGFTINRICYFSGLFIKRVLPKLPTKTRNWTTTFLGLGAIPFIVTPIDTGVEWGMNNSLRRFYETSTGHHHDEEGVKHDEH